MIDLPSFYMDMSGAREGVEDFKSTTRDVAKLLKQFNEQHVDAVVIDLRKNGGGSLTEAINLTGLFIDTGPVVQVKDADGRVQHYDDMEKGMGWTGPLVVMTSKFSASASEIFAGAIQDYRRGLIVGDTSTHGKGTVQSLLDLGRQLFRIPNCAAIGSPEDHHAAVLPPERRQHAKPGRAGRRGLALAHQPTRRGRVEPGLRLEVRSRSRPSPIAPTTWSMGRCSTSYEACRRIAARDPRIGTKVLQNITRYNAQKKRKRVPAQRAEIHGRTGRIKRRQGRRKGTRRAQQSEWAGLQVQARLLQRRSAQHRGRLLANA